jgi:hypothetical protein
MAAGAGLIVIVMVAAQPAIVYDIVAVPAAIPLTTPEPVTLAVDGALLLHVPPGVPADSIVVAPVQPLLLPVSADGDG